MYLLAKIRSLIAKESEWIEHQLTESLLMLLILPYPQITGDRGYLSRAKRGAEAIWERGLLTKGCGLCHGSAGSGYALLSVYQHTGELKYLQMAGAVSRTATTVLALSHLKH